MRKDCMKEKWKFEAGICDFDESSLLVQSLSEKKIQNKQNSEIEEVREIFV
jgi:hypothetical protein